MNERRAGTLLLALAINLSPLGPRAQSMEENETGSLAAGSAPPASMVDVDRARVAALITEETNAFRVDQGLDALEVDASLAEAARYFAGYMAEKDRYGHEADGSSPADRAARFGYRYCIVSENIAYWYRSNGASTARLGEHFVEGWKDSPDHRRNMLDPVVGDTGVAVARSRETDHWYAVQLFGRPRSAALEFTIANRAGTEVRYALDGRVHSLPPRFDRTHRRCREAEVEFRFPQSAGGKDVIEPQDGERYVVEQTDRRLQVHREAER